jgi:uncharacterized YigZ family protein
MNKKEGYITIKDSGVAEFEEKRSLFIGYSKHIESEAQALDFIKSIKQKHSDATHNVFGYILNDGLTARYSDDGEPQGTAGMPVLDAIRKSKITDACVVVTRYFGGTLLGAGGLVRAYSKAAHDALVAAGTLVYERFSEILISISYSDYQKYISESVQYVIITDNCDFSDAVNLKIAVKSIEKENFIKMIKELSAGKANIEVCGERYDCVNFYS